VQSITIATRASQLALWQANYIKTKIQKLYPDIEVKLNKIVSKGDKILDKPLALIGGKGHFTKELEDAMLNGEANMAVHSLKDVPTYIPDGLKLAAVTKRKDQRDIFVSHKYKNLKSLPKGATVGTTSLRRQMQLSKLRPDIKTKELRGNINTRLKKLAMGQYDAIVLAYIGLKRLDLLKNIPYAKKFKLDDMIPPMGQASLGIEIIDGDKKIEQIVLSLNDENSYICAKLERDFIDRIQAGCSAPVACHAKISDDIVDMEVMIGLPNGENIIYHKATALKSNCENLGLQLASDCILSGAKEVLKKAEQITQKQYRPERL